ncbi:hypothetical protein BD408DRAFT_412105 [Parasitella parasitica]|nr:hypothetical protein BD408DRAFT_412105 [Parasitella parasitica]
MDNGSTTFLYFYCHTFSNRTLAGIAPALTLVVSALTIGASPFGAHSSVYLGFALKPASWIKTQLST